MLNLKEDYFLEINPTFSPSMITRNLNNKFPLYFEKNIALPIVLLSPLGDLEMDLSGDIQSIQSIQSIQHLGLSVQNCSKPFNSDQTR